MKIIASILTGDGAAKDKAFGEGLYIAGNRYVLAKADDEEGLYARSVHFPPPFLPARPKGRPGLD